MFLIPSISQQNWSIYWVWGTFCNCKFLYLQEQTGHQSSGKLSKGQGRWKDGASTRKNQSSFMHVSSETLWSDIQEFTKLKYQVSIINNIWLSRKNLTSLNNFLTRWNYAPWITLTGHNSLLRNMYTPVGISLILFPWAIFHIVS